METIEKSVILYEKPFQGTCCASALFPASSPPCTCCCNATTGSQKLRIPPRFPAHFPPENGTPASPEKRIGEEGVSHSGQRGSMPLFRQFHLSFYTACQQHDEVSLLPASLYTCASPRNVLISSGSWPDASIRSTLRFVS
ncbi:MAG: hypothetical protein ACPIOQ_31540, partial [Promethearchaeia archaeon]